MTFKAPTKAQRKRWDEISLLGCVVGPSSTCRGRTTIHHCGTGAGGRKNHDKVIPLCWEHHLGDEGIDGGKISKRQWQAKYGSEVSLMVKVQDVLDSNRSGEEFNAH